MSASEMLCLVNIIAMVIACLVPKTDKYWGCLILLKQIANIVTSKKLHTKTHDLFEAVVAEYLSLLRELFHCEVLSSEEFILIYMFIWLVI